MAVVSNLTWINLSKPEKKIPDREIRVRIRSHVTTLQHRKRKVVKSDRDVVRPRLIGVVQDGSGREDYPNIFYDKDEEENNHPDVLNVLPTVAPSLVVSTAAQYEAWYPNPYMYFLHDPMDDLDRHVRQLSANVPDVLKYYERLVARQAPRFRSMSSLPPASSGNTLIPYLTTDPALLASASLLILSGMRSFRPHIQEATEAYILQLRLYTLSMVQRAVDSHAISDQLVLAVGLLMVYETIFGRPERYHVHSQDLRDLVRLRGGLQNLGLGGLIEALVLWYDANTASINGCTPYLHGIPRSKKEGPKIDREHFLCWVPEGRTQQEKVSIEIDYLMSDE